MKNIMLLIAATILAIPTLLGPIGVLVLLVGTIVMLVH